MRITRIGTWTVRTDAAAWGHERARPPRPRRDPAAGAVARRAHRGRGQPRAARPATASRSAATRRRSASLVTAMTALWFAHLDAADRVARQAARLAGLPRDPVPAGQPRPLVPDAAARPRRPAVLPEPHQGPRRGRLLHRLGRARRRGAAVRRGHPPLRRRALRRRARAQPVHRAASATPSSTRATSGRRSPTRRPPGLGNVMWLVDFNRQSLDRVVPGRADRAVARPVRGRRLARRRGEVRTPAAGGLRPARAATPAAGLDRRDAERAVPVAVRADRRRRCASSSWTARRRRRRRARRRRPRRRSSRPLVTDLGGHDLRRCCEAYAAVRRGHRPPERRLRLHREGLGPADGRQPAQPLRPALRRADRRAARRRSGSTAATEWDRFDPASPAGRGAARRAELARAAAAPAAPVTVPDGHRHAVEPNPSPPRRCSAGCWSTWPATRRSRRTW